MKVRATQAIMECLLEQEVDTVFGYPGGTILNLYDELYHYQDKIHHVLTAHEQGAAHAADGYARSTGKVGVCFATSGPGATNLTTGIATAYMDSSPVVFITCNVSEGLLGKDSFQEVDITGIAMPITKATYLVRDPQTIPDVMRQAFAVAATGRPGPVLIDFLKNVTFLNTMIDYEFIPWNQNRGTDSIRQLAVSHGLKAPEPDLGDIDTLVEMIAQSERPLLICGGGVVRGRADRQVRTFAEKLDAPVAITVMGGGGFPGAHPLTTGEHGVQILVQKGLEPPLSAAGVHLLKEPFQPRLGPSRTAPDLYAPAQPHQLHQGGVHDGDRLPDGPVQLQLPPAQGHIPVQRAEGMPLLVPKLDLRRLRRRFFPHEPFQFLPSIPAVRIRAASLIRRPAPPYWRRIHPFSGLPL